mmetsp:Transcript_100209/g.188869  ORF Transcript_100209/g.188869 Transcript_100209/m.188869 type:complete len:207 (+) Transcript_100209:76-696(+)
MRPRHGMIFLGLFCLSLPLCGAVKTKSAGAEVTESGHIILSHEFSNSSTLQWLKNVKFVVTDRSDLQTNCQIPGLTTYNESTAASNFSISKDDGKVSVGIRAAPEHPKVNSAAPPGGRRDMIMYKTDFEGDSKYYTRLSQRARDGGTKDCWLFFTTSTPWNPGMAQLFDELGNARAGACPSLDGEIPCCSCVDEGCPCPAARSEGA